MDARKNKKGKAKNDQMIVNGTIAGESVKILIDTGASLTFISGTFLKKNNIESERCEKLLIRLGDNSTLSEVESSILWAVRGR